MIALAISPPPPTYIFVVFTLLMTSTLFFLFNPLSPWCNSKRRRDILRPQIPLRPPAAALCLLLPVAVTKSSPLVCCYHHLSPATAISLICCRFLSATESITKSHPPPLSPLVCRGCFLSTTIVISCLLPLPSHEADCYVV